MRLYRALEEKYNSMRAKNRRRLKASIGIFVFLWIFFPNHLVIPNLVSYATVWCFAGSNINALNEIAVFSAKAIGKRGSIFFLEIGLQSREKYVQRSFYTWTLREYRVSIGRTSNIADLIIAGFLDDSILHWLARSDGVYHLYSDQSTFTKEQEGSILYIFDNLLTEREQKSAMRHSSLIKKHVQKIKSGALEK